MKIKKLKFTVVWRIVAVTLLNLSVTNYIYAEEGSEQSVQKLNLSVNYRHLNLDRCSFISDNCDLQGTSSGMNTRILLLL
jgi:hypothetical protein